MFLRICSAISAVSAVIWGLQQTVKGMAVQAFRCR
jgi:hypothetical protein